MPFKCGINFILLWFITEDTHQPAQTNCFSSYPLLVALWLPLFHYYGVSYFNLPFCLSRFLFLSSFLGWRWRFFSEVISVDANIFDVVDIWLTERSLKLSLVMRKFLIVEQHFVWLCSGKSSIEILEHDIVEEYI